MKRKQSWQNEWKKNITTAGQLLEKGLIKADEAERTQAVIDEYPMSITEYYASLIKKADCTDPIYKMCVASINELSHSGRSDTSGEQSNTVSEGIQHKYGNTVLLLSTNVCAMYCRHCFRKRLVGQSEEEILSFIDSAVEYVSTHSEVDNVLISGGDALMNSNKVIERYLKKLVEIPHIKFIRIGSRAPVVFPQRILDDKDLIEMLQKYRRQKAIYIVTQFNHPTELTPLSIRACKWFRKAGIPVLNQTVLLHGVNDNADTLVELFNGLVANGITPYYLFQCRPVKGVKSYFSIPLLDAVELVDNARARLSGMAKRFRFAMSHYVGKMEILGKTKDGRLLLKQHQAKDPDDLNKIFTVRLNPKDSWLKDDFDYDEL